MTTMIKSTEHHLDDEIISRAGLRPSSRPLVIQPASQARVFEFPALENVFVMERDFYGNEMPDGSCFLVFNGRHGLLGEELRVETLRNASTAEIREIVLRNSEG